MKRSGITIKDVLKAKCGHLNQHLTITPKKKNKPIKGRNDSKEVQWLHWQLKYWCLERNFIVIPELKFDKKRKYRFDFAVMKGVTEEEAREFEYDRSNIVSGIEYQGGIFMVKSGHSKPGGATRDCDKSNLAQSLGWPLLTFTALNYQTVLQRIETLING